MTEQLEKVITFPPKFHPFVNAAMEEIKRYRYLVLYGGRASAKTTSCAKLLLFMGSLKPLRILCARQIMSSIDQSVYQVLVDNIKELGLENFYDIERHAIYGRNDIDRAKCTTIKFAGLATNIDSVRSMESLDLIWLEECHDLGASAWAILDPTLRKMGSQIWCTYNPRFATDVIHQNFVMQDNDDALVIQMNYVDNPFIVNTNLLPVIEKLKQRDFEAYLHVYMGACQSVTEGAVLAKEIKRAEADKHFTHVPYDPSASVEAFYDLGWADSVVILFAQKVPGGEIHIIDCIEGSQEPMSFYLNEIKKLDFPVNKHWLPWDAHAKQLGTGLSTEEMVRNAGNRVQIVPKASITDGIQAVRAIFPMLWFDSRNCSELLTNLRLYRYTVNDKTIDGVPRLSQTPVHDHSSHFFDALRCMAMALRAPKAPQQRGTAGVSLGHYGNLNSSNWMKSF